MITAQYVPPTTAPIDWATNQAATYTQTYTITGLEPTFSMTTARPLLGVPVPHLYSYRHSGRWAHSYRKYRWT